MQVLLQKYLKHSTTHIYASSDPNYLLKVSPEENCIFQSPNLQTFEEPRNRFRQPMKHTTNRFIAPARQAIEVGGIDYLESNPGLLKSLQIRALDSFFFSRRWPFPCSL